MNLVAVPLWEERKGATGKSVYINPKSVGAVAPSANEKCVLVYLHDGTFFMIDGDSVESVALLLKDENV